MRVSQKWVADEHAVAVDPHRVLRVSQQHSTTTCQTNLQIALESRFPLSFYLQYSRGFVCETAGMDGGQKCA